ncbi:MAG: polysaccharide deacetylase family protein [Anaerolineae bacterium]
MTRTRTALIIAVIAVSLIIAGGLTMVPEIEQASSQPRAPEVHPEPVTEVRRMIGETLQRWSPDDMAASKPKLQVAPDSELTTTTGMYLPYLEQHAVPVPAAETVTPNDTSREPLLPPPDGTVRDAQVPILMYHYISELPLGADEIRIGLSVTPADFEAHLQYLKENGYHTISLHQLLLNLTRGEPLPANPIILTFDDGYRDNYENAFPLLQKYGFTATFFLITNFIDEERPAYVTWDQVKRLAQAGNEIGAHTRDHPDLRGKDIDFLVWQILGSKEAIQNGAGITPRFFSYPSGKYDGNVIAVLASAHYWGAVTVKQGIHQSSETTFELQRIRIDGGYGVRQLDWVLNYYLQP